AIAFPDLHSMAWLAPWTGPPIADHAIAQLMQGDNDLPREPEVQVAQHGRISDGFEWGNEDRRAPDGRCFPRLWPVRPGLPEFRYVLAFWHCDAEAAGSAIQQVESFEGTPQPACFHSNHRIELRIEAVRASEDGRRYIVGLQARGPSGQCFLDHVFKETAGPIRCGEIGRNPYATQILAKKGAGGHHRERGPLP